MAPTKSIREEKTKPLAQRKSARHKSGAARQSGPRGKENAPENGRDSPRQTDDYDSHERNWWVVHVQKAAALVERCTKAYGWNRAEAKRILAAYRRFLTIKKERGDRYATRLAPCWPVNQMWSQHAQMEDYDYDIRSLLGHVLAGRALPAGREWERARREEAREALKDRFGGYDEKLWDDVRVVVRDQLGLEEALYLNRWEPMSALFGEYAERVEEGVEKFEFSFDGRAIGKEDTLLRLGLDESIEIEASHIAFVGVTVRHPSAGKELCFLAGKTEMMSGAFDDFARVALGGADRTGLVFLLGRERVFGYESPVALKLKSHDNVIDAVPLESYRGCRNFAFVATPAGTAAMGKARARIPQCKEIEPERDKHCFLVKYHTSHAFLEASTCGEFIA